VHSSRTSSTTIPPGEFSSDRETLSRRLARILWESPPNGTWRLARTVNALLIALMAFLLALPLPSAPIFPIDGLPAYAVILLAATMMEDDGVMTWCGYAMALATLIFFVSIAGTIVEVFQKLFVGT